MDITSLGIVIDAGDIKRAVEALNKLQQASKEAEKNTKALGETADSSAKKVKDGADQAALALQREARAQRAAEQAALAKEKTATQTAKTAAISASTAEKALNQEAARIRAATRLEEGLARQRDESAKRLDLISTKQAQAAALQSKYTSQAQAIQERASAYTLNQQSLIEQRALKTQNSITSSAQRAALMQEKFEFQKAQAAERAARRSTGAWSSFRETLSTLSDATVGGFGLAALVDKAVGVVKVADNMTLLDSRLKLATKSQEDFVKTQTAIRESSLKTGLSLEAQIDGFTQLERSTRAMKLSSEQLTFLTESFGKAAVVSGASTESYKSALTQLNQGFASGVIRGQEFNSVAEQAPAVMEALAAGLRGSNKEFDDLEKKGFLGVAALRKLAGEGKLVNGITIPALIEGLKQTNKQFDEMPLTVQRATEQISTAYKVWLADQNTALAGTSSIASGLSSVATNFAKVTEYAAIAGQVVAVAIGGKLVSSMLSAASSSKVLETATGAVAKKNIELADAALKSSIETQKLTKAELDAYATKNLGNTQTAKGIELQNNYRVATDKVAASQTAYSKALSSTAVSARLMATATTAAAGAANIASKALAAVGGIPTLIIGGVILIIQYWDNIRAAMGSAASQAKLTGQAIEDAVNKRNFAQAKTQLDDLNKQYQKAEESLLKVNQRLRGKRESGQAITERDLRGQQAAADNLSKIAAQRSKALETINSGKKSQASEALALIEGYGQTNVFAGSPLPDGKPPKAPSLLGAGATDTIRAESAIEVLEDEIELALRLGTAKDNLNEHEKKAITLGIKLGKLKEDAKNYNEAKTNLEAAISFEKLAGAKQRELDTIQKRNQAILDWEKATDKVIEKQEDLARYTAVDLGGKIETAQEASARRTKENYEAALRTLKAVDEVLSAPEGVSGTKKRQKLALVMDIKPVKSGANFEDQIAGLDKGIKEARSTGDLDVVEKLEKDKTAIIEEQTRQRNEIREKENALLQENLSNAQGITGSFLDVLKNAGQEQSGIYKALFAVDKAFAIAKSIIAIQTAMASASMSLPFPANLGAIATVVSSTAGIISTISSTNLKFAKGAAFSGSVGAGSDVLTTPTTFPMSGGRTGLAGEVAGSPEAIMPLSRDANGRLGVNVNGGSSSGGGSVQQNNITINVSGSSTNEETAGVISRELVKTMERIADARIVNAKRPNGVLTR